MGVIHCQEACDLTDEERVADKKAEARSLTALLRQGREGTEFVPGRAMVGFVLPTQTLSLALHAADKATSPLRTKRAARVK